MSANRTAAARTSTSALDPEMEFDRLYRQRSGAVYSMMLRLSRSTGVAEDLMQETFLRGWRAFPTFRGESAPATWLHVIALRVWSDWARAFRPDIADIDGLEGFEGFDERVYADSIATAMPDTHLDLEASIARLPIRMREALVLHYLHDYSVQQVADALGKSPGTVKAQLYAARERLRRELT